MEIPLESIQKPHEEEKSQQSNQDHGSDREAKDQESTDNPRKYPRPVDLTQIEISQIERDADSVLQKKQFLPISRSSNQLLSLRNIHVDINPAVFIAPHKGKSIGSGGVFSDLLTDGDAFIDKSLFIKEIIDDSSKVILLTMPRRWGKTLNMDMLRRFLSIETDLQSGLITPHRETDNFKLFNNNNLKIVSDNNSMKQYHGKFPVIFLDLKSCKRKTFTKIESAVRQILILLYEDFGCLAKCNRIYSGELTVKDQYQLLLKQLRDGYDFSLMLKQLTKLLYIFHNDTKVWILIDEYDAAANEAYRTLNANEAQDVAKLFAEFLEPALKTNDYLHRSVITGIQYLIKSGNAFYIRL
eukprot:gene9069-18789_t